MVMMLSAAAIAIDKHPSYQRAISIILGKRVTHGINQYLNNYPLKS